MEGLVPLARLGGGEKPPAAPYVPAVYAGRYAATAHPR